MYRVDDPTAKAILPTPSALGTQGYYGEGDPGAGEPATIVRADHLNMIQEELISILTAAGLTPSKTTYNQVLQSINALIAAAVGSPHDTPFMAGWGGDFAGEDLAVQGYGAALYARNVTIVGDIGAIVTAPTGADLLIDYEIDGVSIYSSRPKFTAGGTVYTAGTLTTPAGVNVNAGQLGIFKVEQIGSTIPGQKLAWTVKAKVR